MKKLILIAICFSFIVSCAGSGQIQVKNDSFKNSTVITMDLDHDASIDGGGIFKGVTSFGTQYYREIKDGGNIPTTICFKLIGSTNVNDLKSEAYIKIDDKVTKLNLTGISSEIKTNTSSETKTSKNMVTKKDEVKVETKTTESKILSGKMALTDELEKAVLNANNIEYRLYAMTDAITLKVTDIELTKIKKYLNTTGKEK